LLWIDKPQLDAFAQSNAAQRLLPRLVGNLILAVADAPEVFRFLTDEAAQIRGYDGALVSRGAPPFVPAGKSYWEFGCDRDYVKKARKSVRDRTSGTPRDEQAESALVVVTPWHYDRPRMTIQVFEAELLRGTGWKSVKLLDGAVLKHWLEKAPAVAARWARQEMGGVPVGVRSTDEFWEEYASRFSLPITERLLLAGRKRQADELVARLLGDNPDRITVAADSSDEAVAFAVAALRSAEAKIRLVLEARTIVIDTQDAARDIGRDGLKFLPSGAALQLAGLLSQRGPTVVPVGRYDALASGTLLGRPPRHEFAQALQGPEISSALAAQCATECGRSVTVLSRLRASASAPRPTWAANPPPLVPALLAGGWDASNAADRGVLARLAGVADYATWQATVQPLLRQDDPMLECEGTVWKVRAPVDALMAIGSAVAAGTLDTFRSECVTVFGEIDVNLRMSGRELAMAGPGLSHSSWLREGLANTLLLIATQGTAAGLGPALEMAGGQARWVDRVVASLPGLADDVDLLSSLGHQLPLFAEAAPIPFVSAVKALLRRCPEEVRALFLERVDFLTPVSRHVDLLWALETIAWDTSSLTDAVTLLAKLAAMDPGGRIGNRPSHSLREILLPWLPGTNASVEKRIACMQAVARIDAGVGWKLAVDLLPSTHPTSDMTARPRYREAAARDECPPEEEVGTGYQAAATLALRLVESDTERWTTLIERFPSLSAADLATACGQLAGEFGRRNREDRYALWKCLKRLAVNQAEWQDADWTLKGENLALVQRLAADWAPDDPVAAAAVAYEDTWQGRTGSMPGDGSEDESAIRVSALRRLLQERGHAGIHDLVRSGPAAWRIAHDLAPLIGVDETLGLCLDALAIGGADASAFASTLSGIRFKLSPEVWLHLVANACLAARANPGSLAVLLLGFPDGPTTWDFVAALGDDVRAEYWKQRSPWHLDTDTEPAIAKRPIEEYLRVGRAWSALKAIGGLSTLDPELAFKALDEAVEEVNSGEVSDVGTMVEYYVDRVFEKLRTQPDVDEAALARREFAYLPCLIGPGRNRTNLALFSILSRDPRQFVGLLEIVFRAAGAQPTELDARGHDMWRAAYKLLSAFKEVPGCDAGRIDAAGLRSWVGEVLRLSAESDRADIGASFVGKLLAHAPGDVAGDGAWPATEVRDLIEDIASEPLEQGIAIERFNMRGVYGKQIYEGGGEERKLATTTRSWQDACTAWPRTSEMLGKIAAEWEAQADRADQAARQALMRD
jgi:hypothetical protein